MLSAEPAWEAAKEKAGLANNWFTPEFINCAVNNIARSFLQKELLTSWVARYQLPEVNPHPVSVGIVMAGNIPLVGFHDLLCVFISGHQAVVKASSKDEVLVRHIVDKLIEWHPAITGLISFASLLKGCDAYIATGSNNAAGYFDYYFGRYPHLIRRNRTSVALLTGQEGPGELELLADDVYLYFGLGCRNVTKLYVPEAYDFMPLLRAFDKYNYLAEHHKYKNNYDYNLALRLLNKDIYMSNPSLLLVEADPVFSPISQLHYSYYADAAATVDKLRQDSSIQCIVGREHIPFGQAQTPSLTDYADGEDTMAFLKELGRVPA